MHFGELAHDAFHHAARIFNCKFHHKIFGQFKRIERSVLNLNSVRSENEFGNGVRYRLFREDFSRAVKLHERFRRLLQRHQLHADAFRQRTQHRLDFLRQISRNQIIQNMRIQQVQRIFRNGKRHTIVFFARIV